MRVTIEHVVGEIAAPLILISGSRLQHHNAGTMTRRTANLELVLTRRWRFTPTTALVCGSRLATRSPCTAGWGASSPLRRSPTASNRATSSSAFHFSDVRTNLLVGSSADVNTSCPEYKVFAVDVRVPETATRTPCSSRTNT